ncbi:MAG: penicillin-binding protein 1C [Deltaproteobacteria bacterium]|jgi:penicillin-binding protein 1C|nr:penicillin-binding protein 1C [Deltaproteobacteria bacterium]
MGYLFSFKNLSGLKPLVKKSGLVLLASIVTLALFWLSLGLFPDPLAEGEGQWNYTVSITDRGGRVLRQILPPPMNRRENLALSQFDPHLIASVIAAEDKRFWYHFGIDPLAVLRAIKINVTSSRIISGASTITMQTARLTQGLTPGPKTFGRKLKEAWRALLIERHHTKKEILALYLNLAPAGRLNVGLQAASKNYLGKSSSSLSPGEAAFLAALPASPGSLKALKPPLKALQRRAVIINRLHKQGYLDSAAARRATDEPIVLVEPESFFRASHFVDRLVNSLGSRPPKTIVTTLDLDLQEKIERLVKTAVEKNLDRGLDQAAAVVISIPEREILAYVGSADFFNPIDGQIDGAKIARQPGSALKPFIYGLALDKGLITAASLFYDGSPVSYPIAQGYYRPQNYSKLNYGLISARVALASSLNIPAVNLTALLGPRSVLKRLRELGLSSLTRDEDYYGLGLALGNGEVSLINLTSAYAALADGGKLYQPIYLLGQKPKFIGQIMSQGSSFIISDILADDLARATGFGLGGPLATPYRVSVKTGTSTDFRDNWCLGFTDGFVVGVWTGNFKSKPMNGVSGVTGAGQLWRSITDLLVERRPPGKIIIPPLVESRSVCAATLLIAGDKCPNLKIEYFIKNLPQGPQCAHNEESFLLANHSAVGQRGAQREKKSFGFISPQKGEVFAFDPGLAPSFQKIRAVVRPEPNMEELVFYLNGQEIKRIKVSGTKTTSISLALQKGRQNLSVKGLNQGLQVKLDETSFLVR